MSNAIPNRVLTVAELVAVLDRLPQDLPVRALYDGGYASTGVTGAFAEGDYVLLEEQL